MSVCEWHRGATNWESQKAYYLSLIERPQTFFSLIAPCSPLLIFFHFFLLVCWWMYFAPPFIIPVLMMHSQLTLVSPHKQTTTTTNGHNKIITLKKCIIQQKVTFCSSFSNILKSVQNMRFKKRGVILSYFSQFRNTAKSPEMSKLPLHF